VEDSLENELEDEPEQEMEDELKRELECELYLSASWRTHFGARAPV